MTAAETLAEMRRVEQEATKGPWVAEYSREQGDCVIPHDAASTREAVAITRLYYQTADAEFIAAARSFVPKAVAALEAVLGRHQPHTCPDPSEERWAESGCFITHGGRCATRFHCRHCGQLSPCTDVRAIEEALR